MRVIKMTGATVRIILRIAVFPLRIVLILIEMAIGYAGQIVGIAGSLIGTVFILGALLGAPMGIVTGEAFAGMMLCGICFGVIPAILTAMGTWGIGRVRKLLSMI